MITLTKIQKLQMVEVSELRLTLYLYSIGVKSSLASKGINIEGFLPIMLQEFNQDIKSSMLLDQSRFDAYAIWMGIKVAGFGYT